MRNHKMVRNGKQITLDMQKSFQNQSSLTPPNTKNSPNNTHWSVILINPFCIVDHISARRFEVKLKSADLPKKFRLNEPYRAQLNLMWN